MIGCVRELRTAGVNQPDSPTTVVLRRRRITDYGDIVSDWRTNGGDQMPKAFMGALAERLNLCRVDYSGAACGERLD